MTDKVIGESGAGAKEKLMVYNKIDLVEELPIDATGHDCVFISAKRGDNMDQLMEMIKERIFASRIRANLLIPYNRGDISSYLCEKAVVLNMDYREDGTFFEVELAEADYNRLKKYDTV